MKLNYVILGVSVAFIGMMAISMTNTRAQSPVPGTDKPVAERAPTAPVVPRAPSAAANAVIPPLPPTTIAPAATAPAAPVVQQPAVQMAPVVAQPVAKPVAAPQPVVTQTAPVAVGGTVPAAQKTAPVTTQTTTAPVVPANDQSLKPMSEDMAKSYEGKLSFPLTEQIMILYTQATLRVKKINAKWDVQIAGADSDAVAIEYSNMGVEEITSSLKNIPGLTLAQYNEMTKLTSVDPEFNRVYQAYRQLIEEGKIKPAPLPAVAPPVAAKPAAAANPAAAPVNSGTAPAPQGSAKPLYSQPVSRQ